MNGAGEDRVLNLIPSKGTEKDWSFEDAVKANVIVDPALKKLPESKDLAYVGWKIQNQTDHGACVGMAVADLLNWHFTKNNLLKEDQTLSSRFIYMAAKEMDNSVDFPTTFLEHAFTSIKSGLDIARIYGCVLESMLPFEHEVLCHLDTSKFYLEASDFRIRSYYNLGTNHNKWRTWLAEKGPIVTGINVDATWDNACLKLPNGQLNPHCNGGKLDVYMPGTVRGGHAFLVVGYSADGFKIKNSWGPEWGNNGYGFASIQYANDAFPEAYGITLDKDLPLI
jgi:hypothetical protein